MRIESIKVRNYKVFQDVEVKEIPNMAVLLFLMCLVFFMMHYSRIFERL